MLINQCHLLTTHCMNRNTQAINQEEGSSTHHVFWKAWRTCSGCPASFPLCWSSWRITETRKHRTLKHSVNSVIFSFNQKICNYKCTHFSSNIRIREQSTRLAHQSIALIKGEKAVILPRFLSKSPKKSKRQNWISESKPALSLWEYKNTTGPWHTISETAKSTGITRRQSTKLKSFIFAYWIPPLSTYRFLLYSIY